MQVCSRATKLLRFCFEDNGDDNDVPMQMVDYCPVSANLICQFLDAMENDWKLRHLGRLSFLNTLQFQSEKNQFEALHRFFYGISRH